MAAIDNFFETSIGKVKVKVPSLQGGADRTIYINGSNSGYKLGNSNDNVYNKSSGQEVSTSLKSFIKNTF